MFTLLYYTTAKLQLASIALSNVFALPPQQHQVTASGGYGIDVKCGAANALKPIAENFAGNAIGLESVAKIVVAGLIALLALFFTVRRIRQQLVQAIAGIAGVLIIGAAIYGTIVSLTPGHGC